MSSSHDAVQRLISAIETPLERNDLGRLASMHSQCQLLLEEEAPTGDASTDQPLRELTRAMFVLLERLILDEAADAEAGIRLLPDVVRLMQQVFDRQVTIVEPLLGQVRAASGEGPAVPQSETAPAESPAAAEPAAPSESSAAPAAATPPVPEAPSEPASTPTAAEPAVSEPATTPAPPADAPADEAYVSEPLILDLSEREHLDGFLDEANEHMDAIEAGLLEVETDPTDTSKLNDLFRPFHTIKGIAGFLNLRDINRLTHEIETILDLGRKSELKITPATVDLIFNSVDVLKVQLDAIRQHLGGSGEGPCPQPVITDIMTQLRCAARGALADESAAPQRERLGEILVRDGTVAPTEVGDALAQQQQGGAAAGRIGELLVAQGAATRGDVERALTQQATGRPATDASIRVDTSKLDMLVDAVGELVIAQSMVSLSDVVHTDDRLQRNVSQVTKIVRDVQEMAMAMRMVQIGHTFQKMRRLVRDVARKAGKQVELTISGEDTELDKNVIQQISDPLVHMVRNAVDHGIESPGHRAEAGKPETGHVHLDAFHQGDSIVIEIRDDGKGLDPDQLIAKGIERGLITPEDQLSDAQAFALVLQPGFSTAEKITDISGRGVGMDVVKRNVEKLRGKIEIHSEKGHGSIFSIKLPLTLAIIDGMIVRVGQERLIIPTILIEQSLRPERRHITSVQRRGEMLQVRGELCPLLQLGMMFGYTGPLDPSGNLVVVVQCEGQKVALVIEELVGQQQVVIKTLGERFKQVRGVSGAAILGDGRVGLILEPSGLLALHHEVGGSICTAGLARAAAESLQRGVAAALPEGEALSAVETPGAEGALGESPVAADDSAATPEAVAVAALAADDTF